MAFSLGASITKNRWSPVSTEKDDQNDQRTKKITVQQKTERT